MTTSLSASQNNGRARRCRLGVVIVLVGVIPIAAAAQQPAATPPPLRPGDIVIMGGPQFSLTFRGRGDLIRIDPSTGALSTLSDFDDPSQGPVAPNIPSTALPPTYLAVKDATAVFVLHPDMGTDRRGALLRIDSTTGVRTIVSDFGDTTKGPAGRGLAIEPSGDFLIVNTNALVRVDRFTGARAIVSDFQDPAQGPTSVGGNFAVEESGQIVIEGRGSNGSDALFRVDPSNGVRTLLSDFGNPTRDFPERVIDLSIDFSGNILVTTQDVFAVSPSGIEAFVFRLLRVDPVTGTRALVCDMCPVRLFPPGAMAVEESGDIVLLVGMFDIGQNPVRVDPVTGHLTGFTSTQWASDVAVVPTPLVNGMVSVSVTTTLLDPPFGGPSAPSGVFRITATLTNVTSVPIRNPFLRVAELSGGNLLVSGDRSPEVIALSGKGARQTPDVGSDGVLSPGESVTVEFGIGLQTRQPFTFFVNVFGEADASDGSR